MRAVSARSLQWLCLRVLAGAQSAESAVWFRLRDPDGELAMAQSADLVVAQSAGVAVALFGSLTSSVGGVCNRSAAGFASTAIFITQPSVARMLAWPLGTVRL